MMAIGFGIVALILFLLQQNIASGIFTGLALLSGPSVYPGLLSIGLAGAVVFLWTKRSPPPESENDATPFNVSAEFKTHGARFLLAVGGTILIIGTFFFGLPQGLGAWLSSIQVYLAGWLHSSGITIGLLFLTLVVFELMVLIFFLAASGRRIALFFQEQFSTPPWRSFAFLWLGFALLLAVAYPSCEIAGLSWSILPLWIIAAGELSILLPAKKVSPISVVLAIFTFILLCLFWFTLSAVSKLPASSVTVNPTPACAGRSAGSHWLVRSSRQPGLDPGGRAKKVWLGDCVLRSSYTPLEPYLEQLTNALTIRSSYGVHLLAAVKAACFFKLWMIFPGS